MGKILGTGKILGAAKNSEKNFGWCGGMELGVVCT